MLPEISVIVPVYNAGHLLSTTVRSVLEQSYSNFEIILVDDGSTDNSWEICEKLKVADNRIRAFKQTNNGVTSARKKGWKNSKGNWIIFLDADDTLTENCLAYLINTAISNNCDIVNAGFKSTSSNKLWLHKKTGVMNQTEYLKSFMLNQTYGTVYASIYKKTLIQESTFQFDKSIKIGEDVLTCIEIGLRVKKVMNTHEIVYNYFDDNSSVMNLKFRHPLYLERYFNITSALYATAEDLNLELYRFRESHLYNEILSAFFSPHLPFDKDYFCRLRRLLGNNGNVHLNKKNKILAAAVNNLIAAKIIKNTIYMTFLLKNKVKKKPFTKKEIIY